MLKTDATILANQLNALAEVYGKAAVTAKALEVWFDALKEFPTERVMGILLGWPKMHQRFPAPSDVWKACNEESIQQRENKAAYERAQNSSPRPEHYVTARGMEIIAGIRAMLAGKTQPSPREHWERVLSSPQYGEKAKAIAREALTRLPGSRHSTVEREPGQDDEERMAA